MKTSHRKLLAGLVAGLLPLAALTQVNSGSDGHDGALNPASNLVIDMADHPDGIYHYTSVNIPAGVTVSFIPNAGNKPVVWLVQGNCVIGGAVKVSGQEIIYSTWGTGGPGGYRGGNGGTNPTAGQGPGGGSPAAFAGNASYGTAGDVSLTTNPHQLISGQTYGNSLLLPLLGGSGGGGSAYNGGAGGGGGGGAMLIAASTSITLNGSISSNGGSIFGNLGSGAGSGGGVRLVTALLKGTGNIDVGGGGTGYPLGWPSGNHAGQGRVRLDVFENIFGGTITGPATQGFQPIILPAPGQGIQLAIQSVGGMAVAANPSGVLSNPDVIVPAQQTNPVSIVVSCTNVALNSEITVVVQPANGAAVQGVGLNNAGNAAASTATVSLNMPRGGGIIYAKAVTGIAGTASTGSGDAVRSLAQTGWTATGERFKAIEVTAALGGAQRVAYITESGKRCEAN